MMLDPIEVRLRRIEGQIVGLRRMYKEGRDCMEIAQQIAAVRAALAGVGRKLLSGEVIRCARSEKETEKFAKMIQKLFTLT